MFISYNKVRMHDTDMAGILYFARQFRFAHDAFEDFLESEGYSIDSLFHESNFIFVIVHAEADYLAPLKVGDKLEVHVSTEKLGNSSFGFNYEIYKDHKILVGKAKTVHVCLKRTTRLKMPIPQTIRAQLEKHLV
jgi:1,4-dihydroxy-2-naphthoyl-CoA hydrolase